jgi:hypothetical protein
MHRKYAFVIPRTLLAASGVGATLWAMDPAPLPPFNAGLLAPSGDQTASPGSLFPSQWQLPEAVRGLAPGLRGCRGCGGPSRGGRPPRPPGSGADPEKAENGDPLKGHSP